MKRRAYLSAAAVAGLAGLSGCKGAPIAPGAGRHLLGPDTDRRYVTVADVDDVPSSVDVGVDVEMTERVANADHPASLTVTTTNEGDRRGVSVGTDKCDLFNRDRGGSDDPEGLWLYQAADTDWSERTGQRWVSEDRYGRSYPLYGCTYRRYGKGESVTTRYEVWDDYEVRGYFQPGTYRWEERIEVDETLRDDTGEPSAAFTWGFSLDVSVPDD